MSAYFYYLEIQQPREKENFYMKLLKKQENVISMKILRY